MIITIKKARWAYRQRTSKQSLGHFESSAVAAAVALLSAVLSAAVLLPVSTAAPAALIPIAVVVETGGISLIGDTIVASMAALVACILCAAVAALLPRGAAMCRPPVAAAAATALAASAPRLRICRTPGPFPACTLPVLSAIGGHPLHQVQGHLGVGVLVGVHRVIPPARLDHLPHLLQVVSVSVSYRA
jgi:hypothetical protein